MRSFQLLPPYRFIVPVVAAVVVTACASMPPPSTENASGASEISVVTGFRLDVTVEEEALTEKRVRAVAETEITSVRRGMQVSADEQCVAASRPGDFVARDREAAPGRMALTGNGATLDQSAAVGRVTADPRVYFLGPMEDAEAATNYQPSDFIVTATNHPALAGARFETFRLDILGTPAGDPRRPVNCMPDLGASRRYEGDGERRAFVWHGVDLIGVPERFLTGMLQDTEDVTITVLDAVTRVPIANARAKIEILDGSLMDYEQFTQRYLSGVKDVFILDLYAGFADSNFFMFTEVQSEYRDGDKLRLLKDQSLALQITATAPGYLPVTGRASVGGGQTGLRVLMVSEDGAGAESVPASIQTN